MHALLVDSKYPVSIAGRFRRASDAVAAAAAAAAMSTAADDVSPSAPMTVGELDEPVAPAAVQVPAALQRGIAAAGSGFALVPAAQGPQ